MQPTDSPSTAPEGCVIVVPVANGADVEPTCETSLRMLASRGYPIWRGHGHADLDRGRSLLADLALHEGFDEVVFVGADVTFRPGDVDLLRASTHDVVGAVVPDPHRRTLDVDLLYPEPLRLGAAGAPLEVAAVGTGLLRVTREALQGVADTVPALVDDTSPARWVPFFMPSVHEIDGTPHYRRGDRSFCDRIRACGLTVWADPRIRTGRVGRYAFSWEDAGRARARRAQLHWPHHPPAPQFDAA